MRVPRTMTSARWRWARRAGAVLALPWVLFWAAPLRAECALPSGRWVALEFTGEQAAPFARAVSADVRAGLSDARVEVCPASEAEAATAQAFVQIEPRGRERVRVNVTLREGERESHVSRDVELSGIPRDSRAFAVALAVQELLGADWVGPRDVPEPRAVEPVTATDTPVTSAVTRVPDAPDRRAASTWRLSAGVSAEHFLAGQTQWGGDVGALIPFGERLRLRVLAGARQGIEARAPHGRVGSRALSFTSDGRYLIWRSPLEIGAGIGLHGQWFEFRGVAPEGGVVARELSGLALYAQASLFAAIRLAGPIWLEANAAAGAPLRGLEATDGGETASGAAGPQLSSTVVAAIEL